MHNINTKQSSFNGYLSTIVDVYSDIKELIGSNQLTISFNSMGGSSVGNIHVYMQQSFGELPKPIKTGYIFKGWYRKVTTVLKELLYDDADLVEDFSYVNDTADLTLYARWEKKLLKISFVSEIEEQDAKFSPPELYVKYLDKFSDTQLLSDVGTYNTYNLQNVTGDVANYVFDNKWVFNFNQALVDISAEAELTSLTYYGLASRPIDTSTTVTFDPGEDEADWRWNYESVGFAIKPITQSDNINGSKKYLVRTATILSNENLNTGHLEYSCVYKLTPTTVITSSTYCIGYAYPVDSPDRSTPGLVGLSCFSQITNSDKYEGNYFYTANLTEAREIENGGIWNYIGVICYVYLTNNASNSRLAVYRFHRKTVKTNTKTLNIDAHFYTTNQNEIDELNENIWTQEENPNGGYVHFYLNRSPTSFDDNITTFGLYRFSKNRKYDNYPTFSFYDIVMNPEYDPAILGIVHTSKVDEDMISISCFKYNRDTNLISNNYFYTANSDEANKLDADDSHWEYISSNNFFAYPPNSKGNYDKDGLVPVYRLHKQRFSEHFQHIVVHSHCYLTSKAKTQYLLINTPYNSELNNIGRVLTTTIRGKYVYTAYLAQLTRDLNSGDVLLTAIDYVSGNIPISESKLVGNILNTRENSVNAKLSATITIRQQITERINNELSVVMQEQTSRNTTRSVVFIPSGETINELTPEYIEYKSTITFSYTGNVNKFLMYLAEDVEGESINAMANPVIKRLTTTDITLFKIEINSMEYDLISPAQGLRADEINDIQICTNDNIVLSGKFLPVDYTISFDLNGGTFSEFYDNSINPINLPANGSANLPELYKNNKALVYKTGYSPVGWSFTPGNPNVVDRINYPTSDHTYYLFWRPNTYTITYKYDVFPVTVQTFTYNSSDYLLPFSSMSFSYVFPEFAEWYCPELLRTFKDQQLVNNLTTIPNQNLTFRPAKANQSKNITGGEFDLTKLKTIYNPGEVYDTTNGTCIINYAVENMGLGSPEYSTTIYNIGLDNNIIITDNNNKVYSNGLELTYRDTKYTIPLTATYKTGNSTVISASYSITCHSVFDVVPGTKLSVNTTNFRSVFLPGEKVNFNGIKLSAMLHNSYYDNNTAPYIISEIPLTDCTITTGDNTYSVQHTFTSLDIGSYFSYHFHYKYSECSVAVEVLVAGSLEYSLKSLIATNTPESVGDTSYFEDTYFNIDNYNISGVFIKASNSTPPEINEVLSSLVNSEISYSPKILRLNGATTAQFIDVIVSYTYNDTTISTAIPNIEIKPRDVYLTATTDLTLLYPGINVDLRSFVFKRHNYNPDLNSGESDLITIDINESSPAISANWNKIGSSLVQGIINFDNCQNGLVFSNDYTFEHANDGSVETRTLTYTLDILGLGIAVIPELRVNYLHNPGQLVIVGQRLKISDITAALVYHTDDDVVNIPNININAADMLFDNKPVSELGEYLTISEQHLNNNINVSYNLNSIIYTGIVDLTIKSRSITAKLFDEQNYVAGGFLPLTQISVDIFLPGNISYNIFNNSASLDINKFVFKSINDSTNRLTYKNGIAGILITPDMIINGLIISYNYTSDTTPPVETTINFNNKSVQDFKVIYQSYTLENTEFDSSKLVAEVNYGGAIFKGSPTNISNVDGILTSMITLKYNDNLIIPDGELSVSNLEYLNNKWYITDITLANGLIINYSATIYDIPFNAEYIIPPEALNYPKIKLIELDSGTIITGEPGNTINVDGLTMKLIDTSEDENEIIMTLHGSLIDSNNS